MLHAREDRNCSIWSSPSPGSQPKFAQLNIYDNDNETRNRMTSVRMEDGRNSLKATIVDELRNVLNASYSYVRSYILVRDKLLQTETPTIKLHLLGKRGYDGRRYNLPSASEVAALVVGDYDAADFDRDIVVEYHSRMLKIQIWF